MTLVPLVDGDDFAAIDRPARDAGRAGYGRLLHTWQAIANSPGLFSVYLPFLKQATGPGELDAELKDLVALRVAVLNHCDYSLSHRWSAATAKSVPLELMLAAAAGRGEEADDRTRAALELAELITIGAASVSRDEEPTLIPASMQTHLRELFAPAELVELVMAISVWNALTRFHRVLGLELDMPPAPEQLRTLL
jgi:AhpD family alkylhydroperoxidase